MQLRALIASSAGRTLLLPEGDIEIEIDPVLDLTDVSTGPHRVIGLYINHDLQIVGGGRTTTRLSLSAGLSTDFLSTRFTSTVLSLHGPSRLKTSALLVQRATLATPILSVSM